MATKVHLVAEQHGSKEESQKDNTIIDIEDES